MTASDAYSGPKQESSTLEESHWQLLINKGECNLFRFGFLGVLFLFVCSLACLVVWVWFLTFCCCFGFGFDSFGLLICKRFSHLELRPESMCPVGTIATPSGTIYLYVHLFPVFLSPKINLQIGFL